MENIHTKQQRARKQHKCDYCGGKIEIGEIYTNALNKFDGLVYTWRNHLSCEKLASELDMFERTYNDGGLTGDGFAEFVTDEFLTIVDEDDNKKYTFLERLELVKNHFNL